MHVAPELYYGHMEGKEVWKTPNIFYTNTGSLKKNCSYVKLGKNHKKKKKKKRVFLTCPCHNIYRDEAVGLNPNLPAPLNFVPFGTLTYSPFVINLMSITCIKFICISVCFLIKLRHSSLQWYALSRYIIFITFINVIEFRLTQNILKMGRVN